MDWFLCLISSVFRRRNLTVILAISWTVGLLAGGSAALFRDADPEPISSLVIDYDSSFFELITITALPFVFTLIAILTEQRWMFCMLSFLKAFNFAFVWIYIVTTYNVSAWLLRALLMFGDSLSLPVLWWIWSRSDTQARQDIILECVPAAIFIFAIICVNYVIVVPFCTRLLLF